MWVAPIVLGVALGLFYAMFANYQALPKPLLSADQVCFSPILLLIGH